MIMNILIAIIGCAAIAFGYFTKKTFYWAKGIRGSLSDKPMPAWLGRALFLAIGVWLLIFSAYHLIVDGN